MDKAPKEATEGQTVPNFEELSRNMARFVEETGKATAAYLKPLEQRQANPGFADEVGEVVKTLGHVAESWLVDPQRAIEAQGRLGTQFFDLWGRTMQRVQGDATDPVARPEPKDSRFKDPEWSENPVFDFIKQAYLITTSLGGRTRRRRRRDRRPHAQQGALLPQADLGGAVAVQLPADQS